ALSPGSVNPPASVAARPAAAAGNAGFLYFATDDDSLYRSDGSSWSKVSTGSTVTSADITDGTITGTDVGTDTLMAGNIAAGAVGTSEIADGSIAGADVATDTVTATNIAAGAVTTSET